MTVVDGAYVLTLEFVQEMMKEFKEQRTIHKRFAFDIILKVMHHNVSLGFRGHDEHSRPRAFLRAIPVLYMWISQQMNTSLYAETSTASTTIY